jgi:hypothetical protein
MRASLRDPMCDGNLECELLTICQAASDMPSRPAGFPGQPGPPDTTGRADHLHVAEPPEASRGQLVFVVHGRNSTARLAIFEFLRSIGLSPIEWHQAVAATRKANPYIGEVVDAALEAAQAVVVLWTPDARPAYSPTQ